MRIKYRYGFNNSESDVADFINKQNIRHNKGDIVTVFELFNDDEKFELTLDFLRNRNIEPTVSEAVFSQKEIDEAQWLSIRSTWRYAYPQPEKDQGYIFSTYNTKNYCDQCGKGLIQKENFTINKEPNWGSRNFLMLNWIHDELFITSKAESILRNSNLSGFSIYDVLNRSKRKLEKTKQIYVTNHLGYGLSNNIVSAELVCSKCNFKKYIRKPEFICYNKNVFENANEDIIKSYEKFGEITCASIIFISRRFYNVIKKNQLDRGLDFEPIKLI